MTEITTATIRIVEITEASLGSDATPEDVEKFIEAYEQYATEQGYEIDWVDEGQKYRVDDIYTTDDERDAAVTFRDSAWEYVCNHVNASQA